MIRLFLAVQLIIAAASPSLTDAWRIPKPQMNEISTNDAAGPYQRIISEYKDLNSPTELVPPHVREMKAEKTPHDFHLQKDDKILREVLQDLQKQPGLEDLKPNFLKNNVVLNEQIEQRLLEKVIKRAMIRIAKKIKYTQGTKKRLGRFGVAGSGRGGWSFLNGGNEVRGSLNPCPEGQTRRRGRCSCPYLSSWNEDNEQCQCIYGTYSDEMGRCRSFF